MTSRSAPIRVAISGFLTMMAVSWGAGALAAGAAGSRVTGTGRAAISEASRKDKQKKTRAQDRRRVVAYHTAAARMSLSAVLCEDEAPPDAVQACAGKNEGDTCTVAHDDHSSTGVCAPTPGGVLACQPPPPPPPSQGAIDACAGLAPGDECVLTDDDRSSAGLCKAFASGVVACVKAPLSLQVAIDACTGKAAGDTCSFTAHEDDTVTGACTEVPGLGMTLVCVPPPRIPPAVAACEGKNAGDTCSFERDDETLNGSCVMPPGQTILVCKPEPVLGMNPCAGKNEGDDCTLVHDDWRVDGTCLPVPFLGGILACVPDRLIPPPISACGDKSAGDDCSFTFSGRTFSGSCVAIPDHDLLVCVPPPPQGLIDACVGKAEGDACSATLGDRQFTGACAIAADGVTLACLPKPHDEDDGDDEGDHDDDDGDDDHDGDHDLSPREAACMGLPPGALCSVSLNDRTQNGTCRRDDDDDGDDDADERLACLPPAPPQEAVDACTGLVSGDACSFPWKGVTVSGACRALPGGSTLVCAPLCPHPHRRD